MTKNVNTFLNGGISWTMFHNAATPNQPLMSVEYKGFFPSISDFIRSLFGKSVTSEPSTELPEPPSLATRQITAMREFVLPEDCLMVVCQNLSLYELHNFALVCHQTNQVVRSIFYHHSRELGCTGDSMDEGWIFYQEVAKELKATPLPIRLTNPPAKELGCFQKNCLILDTLATEDVKKTDIETVLGHTMWLYEPCFTKTRKVILLIANKIFSKDRERWNQLFNSMSYCASMQTQDAEDAVEFALKSGADPDKSFEEAVFHARLGTKVLQLFIDHGANINRNWGHFGGQTPLAALIRPTKLCNKPRDQTDQEDASIAEYLLQHGADPNIPDQTGYTPLHHAIMEGNYTVVPILLKHGADVNQQDQNQLMPLHSALSIWTNPWGYRGSPLLRIIFSLLMHGADVFAPHPVTGETPLRMLSRKLGEYLLIPIILGGLGIGLLYGVRSLKK
ncbi:MAG TPA: ankyrin repeat domain-containing protein [Rhabdochlamydiaceae bacterium]|jgi:hypothetical protein|nr:ankyrin repeat domain-containing protein [Rhabdochlamydiaceae bacterium]